MKDEKKNSDPWKDTMTFENPYFPFPIALSVFREIDDHHVLQTIVTEICSEVISLMGI